LSTLITFDLADLKREITVEVCIGMLTATLKILLKEIKSIIKIELQYSKIQ